jgi:alkylated DNA repair dioxygenase AlkB
LKCVILRQLGFFDQEPLAFDETFAAVRRIELGSGAWLEYAPGWLKGHARLFDHLERNLKWQRGEREMYDKRVEVPRLYASLPDDGIGHPVLESMRRVLSKRYGEPLVRTSFALYRDGRDSVAWHGDQIARRMREALVVSVSVGAPRKLLLRPYGGGRSIALALGSGDLFVMGGTCQRTFQHSVPKLKHAEPRIVIMFRPKWDEPD